MKSKADGNTCAPNVGAVIVCAGKGERTGLPYNKIFHIIGQKTVLETTLDKFKAASIPHITVVCSPADESRVKELVSPYGATVVKGGDTRAKSVYNGLKARPCDIVVIHDGARPFVSQDLISRSVISAEQFGSGIAAVRCTDTVKRVGADGIVESLPRSELYNAQTPQTFKYGEILSAYERCNGGDGYTDDAEVYAAAGYSPRLIDGEPENVKITVPSDLIKTLPNSARIGIGFDIHRIIENRPLVLGGVKLDTEFGLDGHSDADVLTHAIMDALLSAADLPDIGVLFPDTDDRFLGISSMTLLDDVTKRVRECGMIISSISAVVIAQRPKLAPHIRAIRNSLAEALDINVSLINVSATTAERLGLIGDGKAIAADAACILTENTEK